MAQLGINFQNIEPDRGTGLYTPPGWFIVAIDESEMKPTKDGAGMFLELRFNVLDGQYKGWKFFSRFNVKNPNQQAVEIAFKQLSAVAHAVGILQVDDSRQLHNIPLKVKVKVRPPEGQYEPQNEITAYRNINENVDLTPQPMPVFAPAAPAAAGAGAPSGGGWQPPQGGFQAPAAAPQPQQPWQQPGAPAAPAAPQPAAPAAQPWQQPQPGAPATPVAPAAPAQQWQQPAAPQPQAPQPAAQPAWAQQPQQQPAAPAAAPQPQQPAQPQHPAQGANPPWAR